MKELDEEFNESLLMASDLLGNFSLPIKVEGSAPMTPEKRKEFLLDPMFTRFKLCKEFQAAKEIRDKIALELEDEIAKADAKNYQEKIEKKSPEEIKQEIREFLDSLKEEISNKKEEAEFGSTEIISLDMNSLTERLEDLNVVLERLQDDNSKLKTIRQHIAELEV